MRITIETIPHTQQRYPTVGDWQVQGEHLRITVSSLGNWRMEACVAIHELVEALICKHQGVTQEQVDAFDIDGEGKDMDEPGDSPKAPYHLAHLFASVIELHLLNEFELDATEYTKRASDG